MSATPKAALFQYLPSSERDLRWGITLTGAGHQDIAPHSPYPPEHPSLYAFTWNSGRTLDELQLIYIVKGRGVFARSNEENIEVSCGSVMIVRPHEWHRYRPHQEEGWMEYWFGIKGPLIDQLLEGGQIPKDIDILRVGLREDFVQHFLDIEHQLQERSPMAQQICATAGLHLLTKALSAHDINDNKDGHEVMKQAVIRMLQSAENQVDLQALSKELDMSYDLFRRHFKNYTGMSPRQYHLQVKIQRACELLNQSQLSINAISERLHFDSSFYFSRLFKARMGQSPLQWRKSLASKPIPPKNS
jgi:AraC-like DNA-binding protein